MAEQYPSVQPDNASPLYQVADYAASAFAKGMGSSGEQAGIIFRRPDGQHVYSTVAPQTLHDKFAIRALMPHGYQIAGIVHSHPGSDWDGQQFSPDDLATATKMNVPSYILFLKDNSMRKYVPGQTQTSMVGDKLGQKKVAYGDPLAAEQPQSPLQQASGQTAQPTGALAALQQ